MSSERPDAPPEDSPAPPTKWPRWRKSMLAGAILLLLASIADAAMEEFPRAAYVIVFFAGYILLSYGFFQAMSARRTPPKDKKD